MSRRGYNSWKREEAMSANLPFNAIIKWVRSLYERLNEGKEESGRYQKEDGLVEVGVAVNVHTKMVIEVEWN